MNHEGQPCRAELSRLLRTHTSDVAEKGKRRGTQELRGFAGEHGQAHPSNPASEADTQVFRQQLRLSPPDSQSPGSPSCFFPTVKVNMALVVFAWGRGLLGCRNSGSMAYSLALLLSIKAE